VPPSADSDSPRRQYLISLILKMEALCFLKSWQLCTSRLDVTS